MIAADNLSLCVAEMESLSLNFEEQNGGFWSFLKFFDFVVNQFRARYWMLNIFNRKWLLRESQWKLRVMIKCHRKHEGRIESNRFSFEFERRFWKSRMMTLQNIQKDKTWQIIWLLYDWILKKIWKQRVVFLWSLIVSKLIEILDSEEGNVFRFLLWVKNRNKHPFSNISWENKIVFILDVVECWKEKSKISWVYVCSW
jgi:hypothetical protein